MLYADYATECYTPQHRGFEAAAILVIALFTIGLPAQVLVSAVGESRSRRDGAASHRMLVRRVANAFDVHHDAAADVVLASTQQIEWPRYAPRYHWFEGMCGHDPQGQLGWSATLFRRRQLTGSRDSITLQLVVCCSGLGILPGNASLYKSSFMIEVKCE